MPRVVNPKLVSLAHPAPCVQVIAAKGGRCGRAAEKALIPVRAGARPEPICIFCLMYVETR